MATIAELALTKIYPQTTVSLGGGSNVYKLAQVLKQHPELKLTLVSPSEYTRIACQELGLAVRSLNATDHVAVAFDGCDAVDQSLNALKSNGGIHTDEKIYAQAADQYILLATPEKVGLTLPNTVQLCLEVIPAAVPQVLDRCRQLGLRTVHRRDEAVAAFARTPRGNSLVDVYASDWQAIDTINMQLVSFNGVISSSYFKDVVTAVITLDQQGNAVEITKEV